MYKPLPNYLTIRVSGIEGLGLFATEKIEQGTNFGVCHIPNEDYENGYIRTPLGGFINHSDIPNCTLVPVPINPSLDLSNYKTVSVPQWVDSGVKGVDIVLALVTKQLIVANTELTTYYSLYNISEEETL